MFVGIINFKCDVCKSHFKGIGSEWFASSLITPLKCPHCGSMHTYPIGLKNLGGVLGPDSQYKDMWLRLDKEK